MHIRSRLRLAALVAAGMLCAAVGTAHANRGQVVNGEANYLTKWGPIEITMGEFVVRCNLVLEGSFAATTFAKRAGTTISRIEEASFRRLLRRQSVGPNGDAAVDDDLQLVQRDATENNRDKRVPGRRGSVDRTDGLRRLMPTQNRNRSPSQGHRDHDGRSRWSARNTDRQSRRNRQIHAQRQRAVRAHLGDAQGLGRRAQRKKRNHRSQTNIARSDSCERSERSSPRSVSAA